MGPLKFISRKRPEETVATAIMAHRTASYGTTHTKEMGMKMLSAYPAHPRTSIPPSFYWLAKTI
jgi:hypothetical protein